MGWGKLPGNGGIISNVAYCVQFYLMEGLFQIKHYHNMTQFWLPSILRGLGGERWVYINLKALTKNSCIKCNMKIRT